MCSSHQHTHVSDTGTNTDERTALLAYMLHHNEHHMEEFRETEALVRAEGRISAADKLHACSELLQQANACLSAAIAEMREEVK